MDEIFLKKLLMRFIFKYARYLFLYCRDLDDDRVHDGVVSERIANIHYFNMERNRENVNYIKKSLEYRKLSGYVEKHELVKYNPIKQFIIIVLTDKEAWKKVFLEDLAIVADRPTRLGMMMIKKMFKDIEKNFVNTWRD